MLVIGGWGLGVGVDVGVWCVLFGVQSEVKFI